ncbi:hypothetical protein [uncultured Friedmanniella sp.]|uniref:hypothetical protein n=1 Tax=uncultured Friedmanniella sp. TaxID=335381 RepID=UPI0035CB80F3
MTSKLAFLPSGVLGRFWALDTDIRPTAPLDEAEAVSGHLQLVGGVVQVKTQRPAGRTLADLHSLFNGLAEGADPTPRWLFGITEVGSVVVPVVTGEGLTQSLGGSQISTRTYRGPTIAVGVGSASGPRVTRLTVDLPFAAWAGFEPMTRRIHLDHEQRWDALDINLRGTEEQPCGRVGPIAVALRGGWAQTEDDQDHLTSVSTALQVITTSKRPTEHTHHVDVAMAVQDLLSLAYGRFLPSPRARIVLEGAESERTAASFYHRGLVEPAVLSPDRTGNRQQDKTPLFSLADLGGPTAVARWVTLDRRYPDAANAVRVRDRTPTTNPTRRVIELGAAIEQYVATVIDGARRARRPVPRWTETPPYEAALALNAGASFAAYVGDPQAWAEMFHSAYLGEKHHRGTRLPANELVMLSSSAQLLLIATLLNGAGRSHRASAAMLDDYRLAGLGEAVRRLVVQATPSQPPRRRRGRAAPASPRASSVAGAT